MKNGGKEGEQHYGGRELHYPDNKMDKNKRKE